MNSSLETTRLAPSLFGTRKAGVIFGATGIRLWTARLIAFVTRRSDADYRAAFRTFQLEGLDNPPAVFLVLGEVSRAVSKRFQVVAPPGNDVLLTIADWRLAEPARASN